ncbi:rRNA maturation RNase YbeY [Flagellimonas lutaonensis]|uniref:Endoribonuclease YbeY n=1 Tax=Flagellimonas lutaonensis TaxID=516051 RepID=A0A0D5YRP2_9FLAO|nr:rRNA maturation RNase YbeY [Allomuricauda lutaonensis]AKA34965.1 Endoribonuclease YbeY [Allomuricauda lutaonensis]
MIDFHFENDFQLEQKDKFSDWLSRIITAEGYELGNLDYVFCDDEYLWDINMQYLNHDTYTDIITFDYSTGRVISGDIFISVERVDDNAADHGVGFENELLRVMCHGVLHLMGYNDKKEDEVALMRNKEDEMIQMFHVEQ